MDTNWKSLIDHKDHYIRVNGIEILVMDKVFTPNPAITYSSSIILNNLPQMMDKNILDIGCGTGVIGISSLLNGAKQVYAVDIDNNALENTRLNYSKYNLERNVIILNSNLFEKISRKFDYIFANLPILDEVWGLECSSKNIIKKYIQESSKYVKKNGKVYFTWASFSDIEPLRKYLSDSKINTKEISEEKLGFTWYLFELTF